MSFDQWAFFNIVSIEGQITLLLTSITQFFHWWCFSCLWNKSWSGTKTVLSQFLCQFLMQTSRWNSKPSFGRSFDCLAFPSSISHYTVFFMKWNRNSVVLSPYSLPICKANQQMELQTKVWKIAWQPCISIWHFSLVVFKRTTHLPVNDHQPIHYNKRLTVVCIGWWPLPSDSRFSPLSNLGCIQRNGEKWELEGNGHQPIQSIVSLLLWQRSVGLYFSYMTWRVCNE